MSNSLRNRVNLGRILRFPSIFFLFLFLFLLAGSKSYAQMIGWGYKDAIQVQNPGPLKLNHQVLLTLNTQALISLGRLQATGADLRFSKDCNGLSQYSYYIESGINTTATKIWVLTDSLAANSNRVITMFYGNSTAPAGSSFDNTFPPSSRLIVSAGTITLNGTNNFSWFEIALGATVLVGPNSPFVINARRIIIAGILDGNGSGHLGGASISNGSGPGGGFASTGNAGTFGAGGASYAGIGGPGGYPPPASNAPLTGQPGLTYENASTDSINMGSGGGGSTVVGGAGGGGITLTGDFVNITGTIRANGAAGTNSNLNGAGGGGSGGGIRIKGNVLTLAGTISANGGTGGNSSWGGGGGGGGRIKIFSDSSISNMGVMAVAGGIAGTSTPANAQPGPGTSGTTSIGTYVSGVPVVTVLPDISLVVSANPICQGTAVTFTASTGSFSNYNFQRNIGAGYSSVQSSVITTYTTSVVNNNYQFRVLASYAGSCIDTSNVITMTVNPIPTITVSGSPPGICPGFSSTVTASGASTYSWAPAGSLSSSTGSTVTATPTATTTYTVTGTSAAGCVNTGTGTITALTAPVATSSAAPVTYCSGESSQLNVYGGVTGGIYTVGSGTITNGGTTYPAPYGNWYMGARHQFLITASEMTAAGATAGNLNSLAFNVSSVNGAPIHQNFTIKMMNTALTSITTWQSGLTTVLAPVNHQPVMGWNVHTFTTPFTWDGVSNVLVETCFNNTSFVTNGNASVFQTSTAFQSCIVYRADNATVCGNNSITFQFNQRPNMRFTQPSSSYAWAPPTGLSSATISNPVTTTTVTTTYTVTLTAPNGCTDTSQITVNVLPTPTAPAVSSNSPICDGSTLNFFATSVAGANYDWVGPAGFVSTQQNPSITNANPSHSGTYSVSATLNGCTSQSTITAVVNPIPSAPSVSSNSPVCLGATLNLTAGSVAGATYSWLGPNGFSSSAQNPSIPNVTNVMAGTYSVLVTVNGCNSSFGTTTVSMLQPATPVITANGPTTFCNGGSVQLTASGAPAYNWSTGATTQSVLISASGSYTVSSVDANGCTGTSQPFTVTVNPNPTVTINGFDPNYCVSAPTDQLTGSPPGGTFSGQGISGNSFSPSVTGTGTFAITYSYTDANGCSGSTTQNTTVNGNAFVSLGPDAIICINGQMVLNPGPFSSYDWQDNSTSPTFTVNGASLGIGTFTFYVNVTDGNGCPGTDTVVVQVDVCTGITESLQTFISILPNPSDGIVNIQLAGFSGPVVIAVMDLNGKMVHETQLAANKLQTQMDLSALAKGVYYLRVNDGEKTAVKKLVLN